MALDLRKIKKRAKSASSRHRKKVKPRETLIREVSAGVELLLPYPAHALWTIELVIERLAPDAQRAWNERYELARAFVAEWINAARELDKKTFAKATFDIWIGQECGHKVARKIQITLAGRDSLPEQEFLDLIDKHPVATPGWPGKLTGAQPLQRGCSPELHVEGGTVAHVWTANESFLCLASERFRRFHQLQPTANDPYRQLAAGVRLPDAFEWETLVEDQEQSDRGDDPKVYIFEVVKVEGRNVPRVSSPDTWVSLADAYDLDDQLRLANVDITADHYAVFQRLHYVRYIRPALRAYCEWFKRPVPSWLADDARFRDLDEQELMRVFGQGTLKIRRFQPLRMPTNIKVRRGAPPEAEGE